MFSYLEASYQNAMVKAASIILLKFLMSKERFAENFTILMIMKVVQKVLKFVNLYLTFMLFNSSSKRYLKNMMIKFSFWVERISMATFYGKFTNSMLTI